MIAAGHIVLPDMLIDYDIHDMTVESWHTTHQDSMPAHAGICDMVWAPSMNARRSTESNLAGPLKAICFILQAQVVLSSESVAAGAGGGYVLASGH